MKRIFDLLVLIVFSPVLLMLILFLTVLIYCYQGRPIFFKQERAGIKGKKFIIYKFRSMTNDLDCNGTILPDTMRITKIGKFLRESSLDELPEFYNVLIGDMSLVGPRPLHLRYVSRYSPFQSRRLSVRPGITGFAQVNGRNFLSWDEKFKMDVWYVDNHGIFLDLKILLITIMVLFDKSNINKSPTDTMDEFVGHG